MRFMCSDRANKRHGGILFFSFSFNLQNVSNGTKNIELYIRWELAKVNWGENGGGGGGEKTKRLLLLILFNVVVPPHFCFIQHQRQWDQQQPLTSPCGVNTSNVFFIQIFCILFSLHSLMYVSLDVCCIFDVCFDVFFDDVIQTIMNCLCNRLILQRSLTGGQYNKVKWNKFDKPMKALHY